MSNNHWLYSQITQRFEADVSPNYDPIIRMMVDEKEIRIYSPTADEYIVNSDVVEKAHDLGATIISYSSSWCGTTMEAKKHAKRMGITIMPHRSFFAFIKRKGIQEKD